MKEIKVLSENNNYIYLEWEKDDISTDYYLMGMNKHFNNEIIKKVKKNTIRLNKDSIKDYINIRVYYIVKDKDCSKDIIIDNTDIVTVSKKAYKIIAMNSMPSYNGITLVGDVSGVYDKYYLYEKIDNEYKLLMVLEDFLVNSEELKVGHTYYMEAYAKENDKLELKAKSLDYVLMPYKPIKRSALPKVSAVIPVYNSEKFISRCIDSILLSTFKDLEIVLIDDESKDKSGAILDWYEREYPGTVRVHHQKNAGVSFARNKGIELARGEFIGLVDNDDLVHPRMYEELYSCAKLNNSDIAIGKTLIREGVNDWNICLEVPNSDHKRYRSYTYEEMFKEKIACSWDNIYFVAVWNKIAKASIMKEHPLPPYNHYEDTAYTRCLYSYVDKFTFCFDAYYVWDKRRRKTTGTASTYNYKDNGDWTHFHRVYRDSNFYAIFKGNKDKMDYIIYDTLKETYDDAVKNCATDPNHELYKINKEIVLKVDEMYDILNMDMIKQNKELYDFYKLMLNK